MGPPGIVEFGLTQCQRVVGLPDGRFIHIPAMPGYLGHRLTPRYLMRDLLDPLFAVERKPVVIGFLVGILRLLECDGGLGTIRHGSGVFQGALSRDEIGLGLNHSLRDAVQSQAGKHLIPADGIADPGTDLVHRAGCLPVEDGALRSAKSCQWLRPWQSAPHATMAMSETWNPGTFCRPFPARAQRVPGPPAQLQFQFSPSC